MAQKTRRITLDVAESDHTWLTTTRFQDGVTISDRLRALVWLAQSDETVADRVVQRAREIAKERSET